ncbi:phage baseplate assembly protein V, partial [Apibacter muscae]|uniref:phage baseplate assembly protein V n=1 Tax=Apibacter muscae TaxID=2509004 RepID=UPI001C86EE9F
DEDAFPACEEQSAIVTDNNDPEGMSRIRVQFPWQKAYGGQSPWIRSITPYAGSGKGMHVVPEIGEEVIVSFENGNAEKPVSLGAMFNGKGKSGHGGAGNFIKGLQTPTGNKIQFNDKEGSALLTDNGGASMKFDGAGNAVTNAAVTHIINVGGKDNDAGPSNVTMDQSGNITIKGDANVTIITGNSMIELTPDKISLSASEININGEKIEVKGPGQWQGGKIKIN